jgi:hypothetical protein
VRKRTLATAVLAAAAFVLAATTAQASPPPPSLGTIGGVVHVKGEASHRKTSTPNLLYHGGPVMHGAAVTAIYWGTSWTSGSDKISWLGTFYSGIGGSRYAGTNTEYTDSQGNVSPAVSYGGAVIDNSPAIGHAPQTSDIAAEVAKMIPRPVANGYYPVYVDTPRGHTGYCAWHSYGTINGVNVRFGFFFNLDGDAGCDPQSPVTSYSQGVAALANVSGHELSEMLTDPALNAWYDSTGEENADKCAWTFGSKTVSFGGTQWKIQGNWSNAAYDSGAGYQRGCIDGN